MLRKEQTFLAYFYFFNLRSNNINIKALNIQQNDLVKNVNITKSLCRRKEVKSAFVILHNFFEIGQEKFDFMTGRKRKNVLLWWIAPVLAVICFGITLLLAKHPEFTENWYSTGLYPVIAKILSPLSSLFPISIDDIFYILLILGIPTLLSLLIFRKIKLARAALILLNTLAILYISFYFLWGFNYYRQDVNKRLELADSGVTSDEFRTVLVKLINETNQSYCTVESIDKKLADSLVEESYSNLAGMLKIDYPAGVRKDKSITFSRFFAGSGISGYFGPFFNEVHVNKETYPLEYPVVLAHEKAHQLGVTSEAEANFYAWLVCSQSTSQELRYSAGSFILRFFFNQAGNRKDYKELVSMIDPRVLKDFDKIREHWDKLRNEKMEKAATKVNDAYLKTNAVEEGVNDYYGVVQFVLDLELDSTFQKKWNLNNE